MTGRYVLRNKADNTYYRANRKGSWDNWVDNINLATVFYTTAINSEHRCMKDCEVVYINFVEESKSVQEEKLKLLSEYVSDLYVLGYSAKKIAELVQAKIADILGGKEK